MASWIHVGAALIGSLHKKCFVDPIAVFLMYRKYRAYYLFVIDIKPPDYGSEIRPTGRAGSEVLLRFIDDRPAVWYPYGEPVISFGDPKHKRSDVTRYGSIQ